MFTDLPENIHRRGGFSNVAHRLIFYNGAQKGGMLLAIQT